MSQSSWDWQEVFMMLMFRLSPKGFALLKDELELPQHSVGIEERGPGWMTIKFITLEKARELQGVIPTATPKVPVGALEGRWMKLAYCLLWKLRRDGIRLTQADWDAVPNDRILEVRMAPDGIEYVPVRLIDAQKTAKKALDSHGVDLL